MKVLLASSDTIGDTLIRWRTGSPYSHTGLIFGDVLIEAVRGGVRAVALPARLRQFRRHEIIDLPCANVGAAEMWAREQIGKPYDFGAILALSGLGGGRDWSKQDRWYCAEHVAAAFYWGDSPLFRREAMSVIVPADFWKMATR